MSGEGNIETNGEGSEDYETKSEVVEEYREHFTKPEITTTGNKETRSNTKEIMRDKTETPKLMAKEAKSQENKKPTRKILWKTERQLTSMEHTN